MKWRFAFLSLSGVSRINKPYYLPLLLIISIVTHFPFVLNGFGELDATKIGVSVIDMIKHGSKGAFINFYFTDVIPLYVLYLKSFMKLINYKYEYLPLVMNYTNAVIGTLTIIPAYILIKRLFANPVVAFCSVLALIFAPVFYQSTIAGFPHLISLFFLLTSFCFYLMALDYSRKNLSYPLLIIACVFLTTALLFKLDYILGVGAYMGFLYVRRIKDKRIYISTFLIITISGLLVLVFRYLIIGTTEGATSSSSGMSEFINFFIGSFPTSMIYLKRQVKPIIYAAGIITFILGIVAFIYHLFKRNIDILIFNLSWAALPTIAWIIINGNNARHNMLSLFPFLVMIVIFFFEKAPKYVLFLTAALILSNYFITSPSSSILRPSGNLFQSQALLEERMIELHARAKEISDINEKKIVVLGYFHNPHAIFEIITSDPSYEAVKIGRENYKIKTGNREFVFIYFVSSKPEEMREGVNYILNKYQLHDYLFTSATFDLKSIDDLGLKTKTLDIIKASL